MADRSSPDVTQLRPAGLAGHHLDVVVQSNYSRLGEHLRQVTPPDLQCSVFCGGRRCKYDSYTYWKPEQMAVDGIYSHWITDDILAMSRPNTDVMKKKDIVSQFLEKDIKTLINLQIPGEHASCGGPIYESGFSYDPSVFMEQGIFYYNFALRDHSEPTLVGILDMVKVMAFALSEGKVAVHCHAGLGRTGVLIACYLVYALRVRANDAIRFLRLKRPNAVQTSGQILVVQEFEAFILPQLFVFCNKEITKDKKNIEFTLQQYLHRQKTVLHGYEARALKHIPKIVYVICERLLKLCGCGGSASQPHVLAPLEICFAIGTPAFTSFFLSAQFDHESSRVSYSAPLSIGSPSFYSSLSGSRSGPISGYYTPVYHVSRSGKMQSHIHFHLYPITGSSTASSAVSRPFVNIFTDGTHDGLSYCPPGLEVTGSLNTTVEKHEGASENAEAIDSANQVAETASSNAPDVKLKSDDESVSEKQLADESALPSEDDVAADSAETTRKTDDEKEFDAAYQTADTASPINGVRHTSEEDSGFTAGEDYSMGDVSLPNSAQYQTRRHNQECNSPDVPSCVSAFPEENIDHLLNDGIKNQDLSENLCYQELASHDDLKKQADREKITTVLPKDVYEALTIDHSLLSQEYKKLIKAYRVDLNIKQSAWNKLHTETNLHLLTGLLYLWLENLKQPVFTVDTLSYIVLASHKPEVCLRKMEKEIRYTTEYLVRFVSRLQSLSRSQAEDILRRFIATLTQQTVSVRDTLLPAVMPSNSRTNGTTKESRKTRRKAFTKLREGTLRKCVEFIMKFYDAVHIESRSESATSASSSTPSTRTCITPPGQVNMPISEEDGDQMEIIAE